MDRNSFKGLQKTFGSDLHFFSPLEKFLFPLCVGLEKQSTDPIWKILFYLSSSLHKYPSLLEGKPCTGLEKLSGDHHKDPCFISALH